MDARDQNKENFIVATFLGGATMREIGEVLGISHQRVSQILARAKVEGGKRATVSPTEILAVCREKETASFAYVARRLGILQYGVARCIDELGLSEAVTRLFQWRQRKARDFRREKKRKELAMMYRQLCEKLGRVATFQELHPKNGVPFYSEFVGKRNPNTSEWQAFKSIRELREAAGIDPEDRRKYSYEHRGQ